MLFESKKNQNRNKPERKFFVKKKKFWTKKVHKKEKSIFNIILRNLPFLNCERKIFKKYFQELSSR